MSLITLQEALDFMNISNSYFTITAGNDVLKLQYDSGSVTNVDIPDGTYSGDSLATAIQTAMNTALTMSGTVTYSSTTQKFSFGAGTGHTLAYTHSGSDAGNTVGFDEDHAAASTLTSDNATGDPTAIVQVIKDGVEAYIQNEYCKQTLESTNHKDFIDGEGDQYILLDHYPIISLNRLSIGTEDAISIKNTNSGAHASVSVSSTAVSLYKDGTTNTLSLSTYSTLTLLVDAINAISGWSAALLQSSFASYPSTVLLEKFGLQCINNNYVYLPMPDEGEDDFEVYSSEGKIYSPFGFPQGHRNIYVDYTAGFATIPADLKLAVNILTKNLYQRRGEESFGLSSYSSGGISASFKDGLPQEAKMILGKYKRTII